MPLLTRVVGTPLTIDIGAGTVAGLAPLLADRRISSGGHVAVVVGPGLGEEIAATLQLENAEVRHTEGGGVEEATKLARELREGFYDALVGIGGGRVATAPIGAVQWVEVDDHADLARAREVACRC